MEGRASVYGQACSSLIKERNSKKFEGTDGWGSIYQDHEIAYIDAIKKR